MSKQVLLTENNRLNGRRYTAVAVLQELFNTYLLMLSCVLSHLSPSPTITHTPHVFRQVFFHMHNV